MKIEKSSITLYFIVSKMYSQKGKKFYLVVEKCLISMVIQK